MKRNFKMGARHSAEDTKAVQAIHDQASMLGADCGMSGDEAKSKAIKMVDVSEGYDIQDAAAVLMALASLAQGEADEADDMQEVCDLILKVCDFIKGECETMLGSPEEEVTQAEPVPPAKSIIAIPTYIKSLHLSLADQQFKDVLAAKFVGKDEIHGYSNLWGNPIKVDLDTEFFTKQTNFWDNVLGLPRPMTMNHNQDAPNKSSDVVFTGDPVIGEVVEFGDDDVGRWYNAVLQRSHAYRSAVADLINQRALGTSSDSAPQYVERQKMVNGSVWLKQWPLFAIALTDVPCEPRMFDFESVYWQKAGIDAKLLKQRITDAGLDVSRDDAKKRLADMQRRAKLFKLHS